MTIERKILLPLQKAPVTKNDPCSWSSHFLAAQFVCSSLLARPRAFGSPLTFPSHPESVPASVCGLNPQSRSRMQAIIVSHLGFCRGLLSDLRISPFISFPSALWEAATRNWEPGHDPPAYHLQ